MGNGIAQASVVTDYDVVLFDIDQKFIDCGLNEINKSLNRMVKKEKITKEQIPQILEKILLFSV